VVLSPPARGGDTLRVARAVVQVSFSMARPWKPYYRLNGRGGFANVFFSERQHKHA
jgi:hypothetical protein